MSIALVDRKIVVDVKVSVIEEQLLWITIPTLTRKKNSSHW
jgi:hypothetical protein